MEGSQKLIIGYNWTTNWTNGKKIEFFLCIRETVAIPAGVFVFTAESFITYLT